MELAVWVQKIRRQLAVEVVNVSITSWPDYARLFAVPAYLYDEHRTLFLGNSGKNELWTWLARLEA
ncbi:MAG: hypothetical protein O3A47_07455 [Chloroflexi bacterium]|nr:hypothetical protein [Chloroflexota bacterium]